MTDRRHAPTPPTATPARAPHDRREEADLRAEERAAAERERRNKKHNDGADDDKDEPRRQGDVLGLSDATAPIPQATTDKGGNPRGIEVGDSDDEGDLKQSPGATSIDMGAGGEGQKIKR